MQKFDLHTHTVFSDGENTPEETVLSAIALGFEKIGFSDHSYTFFDTTYCIKEGKTEAYRAEIEGLKEKYRGKIEILCGIEQDYYAEKEGYDFDYVIGSVHYLKCGGIYIPVDETAEILQNAADKYFGGDIYSLIEEYYRTVGDVVNKTGADIIGHFDLITKFSETVPLFDESHPRYRFAWQSAADKLLLTGKPFEINTGAISRGYRTAPYPSREITGYLLDRGAKFLLSSDSHSAANIGFRFDKITL